MELYQLEKARRIEGMALQLVEATWAEKNNPDMRLEKLETEYPCLLYTSTVNDLSMLFRAQISQEISDVVGRTLENISMNRSINEMCIRDSLSIWNHYLSSCFSWETQ